MNSDERQMLQSLFTRLGDAERGAPPRDGEAESFIRDRVSSAPHVPYYMAQTIIVQEEALKAAHARIEELERAERERPVQSSGGGGGFLSGLFGGGGSASRDSQPMGVPQGYRGGQDAGYGQAQPARGPWGASAPQQGGGYAQPPMPPQGGYGAQPGYGQPAAYQPPAQGGRGGGFLAGAAQTAVGVAGGVVLGNMLGNMFGGSHSFLNPGGAGGVVENTTIENTEIINEAPGAQDVSASDAGDNSYDDGGMQDADYDDPGFGGGDDFEDI
ncbi:DUF2076 domain-containing protein [Aureimonas sp. AU40]|uniref:DUF2076 domain-containing protein n=1 Tax=Aureimonas sp. AU40 TaxID=1637747 RepID=UPI000783FC92|nr:DUF2076 family protein [Aureimonas sp. AU40]